MALMGSRGDFQEKVYDKTVYCSECGTRFPPGTTMLVSVHNGKVKKRVCSEKCRESFDDKLWRAIARVRRRF